MIYRVAALLVVALSACGPTPGSVVEPTEASGMWSGTIVKERPHEAPLRAANEQPQQWAATLSEQERARCKEVAWDAVVSPETWSRYFESPESAAALTLSESSIRYYVDQRDFSTVDVAIPAGGFVGWHPTYIGVTIARGSYEVLNMYSSFWP